MECILGAISNLTAINERFKQSCYENGAIQRLVLGLNSENDSKLVEPSLCALRNLVGYFKSQHIEQIQQDFIKETKNLQTLSHWFKIERSRPVLKAAITVVTKLATNQVNHHILREQKFVHQTQMLATILCHEMVS